MIAILIASRGLIFTKTDEVIDKIKDSFNSIILRTYDKKIPEAQNWLVSEALKTNADFFLFIEEDVVPNFDQVVEMINLDKDIVFVDYGVGGWSCSVKDKKGEVLWCGLGCTLIKRKVFTKLKEPWFYTEKSYRLNDKTWVNNPMKYGGHDIWFSIHAREAGFRLFQVEGECEHLKLDSLGKPEINDGLHIISNKPKIFKNQIIS